MPKETTDATSNAPPHDGRLTARALREEVSRNLETDTGLAHRLERPSRSGVYLSLGSAFAHRLEDDAVIRSPSFDALGRPTGGDAFSPS